MMKAEYLFRPVQLFRRLTRISRQPCADRVEASLAWGRSIRVSLQDNIGPAVATLGVYDLVVAETLWRLTDPNDLALDVGANIGCMTAVLAERAAEVHSFEPHPLIYAELVENAERLRSQGVPAVIRTRAEALGSSSGKLPLHVPHDFRRHRGESSLADERVGGETVEVTVAALDEIVAGRPVGVMKMDVEGFEAQVLQGATRLLGSRRLRDCVFEEHRAYPTVVTAMFEVHGYTIFRLARRLMRPRLLVADSPEPRSRWEATSFLATVQPDRARQRMAEFGWRCLRAGS
jgi:FkbM family methyltransferase